MSTGNKAPLGQKSAPPPLPLRFWVSDWATRPDHLTYSTSLTDLTCAPAVELVRIRYASALRVRSFKFHQNGAARASTVKGRRHTKKDVRVYLGNGSDQRPRFATSACVTHVNRARPAPPGPTSNSAAVVSA